MRMISIQKKTLRSGKDLNSQVMTSMFMMSSLRLGIKELSINTSNSNSSTRHSLIPQTSNPNFKAPIISMTH